jgi:uncharacterized protein (DUF362 family)
MYKITGGEVFMQRRDFIKNSTAAILGSALLSSHFIFPAHKEFPDAVWVENGEPQSLLRTALREIGGLQRFISKGDIVVIKPNIGWDRAPQYAADTNPELVKTLVEECFNVGAKEVKIFDRTCNNPQRCYKNSQIETMATAVGAEVTHIKGHKFVNLALKKGEILKEWPVYKDYLEADKVINVPIVKHHGLDRVTLGLKNLMGIMGGNRGSLHSDFAIKIIDINSEILPHLTIMDGYRMLTKNGPVGGNLADVKLTKTLIISDCVVTADYLALGLFGHKLKEVTHIQEAVRRDLNKYDLQNLNLKKVSNAP